MYTVILAGGTGSGKSAAARWLEEQGCARIDLDQLSREVLEPGSATLQVLAEAFGHDLLDPTTGVLDRGLLARRAFATPETTAQLEAIELPAIRQLMVERLGQLRQLPEPPAACIVEVPLLDRLENPHEVANEVVVVSCPVHIRRQRAIERGMEASDFDARVAHQPTDAWLLAHADTVIDNSGGLVDLYTCLSMWFAQHERGGWQCTSA